MTNGRSSGDEKNMVAMVILVVYNMVCTLEMNYGGLIWYSIK